MGNFLYFSALYLPHLGGVESYTKNLSAELTKSGNRVVIATSALNNDEGVSKEEDIDIYRFPSFSAMEGRFPLPKKNALWRRLWKSLCSLEIDHVLINTRYYYMTILGLKYAKEKGIRALLIDHSTNYLHVGNNVVDFVIRCYEKMITRKVIHYDPLFLSVSLRGKDWLRKFGINVFGILPNAVNSYSFSKGNSGNFSTFNTDDKFHVVYAGRLIKEKGIIKLCEVVESFVNRGYEDIVLDIAGSGLVETEINSYVNRCNNINFYGRLNAEELASLLNASDVFCLPSDYPEGFPTVLLEAASCGMGIIMSNTGGSDELVPAEQYGIVLSDTSLANIEAGILRFYSDRQFLKEAADNIQNRVISEYSWKKTANKLIRYCDSFEKQIKQ